MPRLNSEDIQILYDTRKRKFKYAFIDDYHGEEKLLRYGDAGINEFEYTVKNYVLDSAYADENFNEDDWECTYPGDRDSPPEYDLREDAEAYPVIQVLRDTNEYMLLDFSEYSLYLFNTPEIFQHILNGYDLSLDALFKDNIIDVYPENLKAEMIDASDYNVTADELKELFN